MKQPKINTFDTILLSIDNKVMLCKFNDVVTELNVEYLK